LAKVSKSFKKDLKHKIATAIDEHPDSGICKRLCKLAVNNYSILIGRGYTPQKAIKSVIEGSVANVSGPAF
jgi:hypothetical protein